LLIHPLEGRNKNIPNSPRVKDATGAPAGRADKEKTQESDEQFKDLQHAGA
jgi:hypothetical protein